MSRVIALLPARDECESIAAVVTGLRELACAPHVVVIDDASTDGTAEVARGSGAEVLRLPFGLGVGGAVQAGMRLARRRSADVCVRLDADGQHRAEDVEALVAPVIAGEADVVIGTRFATAGGDRSTVARRLGIRWLTWLVHLRCGVRFSDPTSGMRAYSPRGMAWVASYYPEDYPEPQVLAPMVRTGLRVSEVPVTMRPRVAGRSKIRGFGPFFYVVKVSVSVLLGSLR